MKKATLKSAVIMGITMLLALTFLAAGLTKFAGVTQVVLPFERLGMPFMAKVIGLLEIAGAIGLLIPRLRHLAALGLSAIMLGAIVYHLTLDPEKAALPGIILLIFCGSLAWIQRPAPSDPILG
ncbi:DoxX family protein [uncultured Microbulbifer sp.]|uniref:DoxX family protein n=1 Tax=uncultured Microbulbifer sp. TaxID=348147 RepID=UPI00261F3B6F|nr:DoxX family protein [uncultured Microbulbifer sp.]